MEFRVEHAHNEHLEILSELGIVGYILFLCIIIDAVLLLLKKNGIIELGIAAAIIGILIDGIFSQNLRHIVISSLLWLYLGFASIRYNSPETAEPKMQASFAKIMGCLIIVIILFFPMKYAFDVKDSDYHLKIGLGNYVSARVDQVVPELKQSIELQSDNKAALYYLGASYLRMNDTINSLKYYQELLKIDPNFIQANYYVATIYLNRGELQKAKEYFLRQVKDNNMYWQAYYALAYISSQGKDNTGALAYLTEIEKINNITPLSLEDYSNILSLKSRLSSLENTSSPSNISIV